MIKLFLTLLKGKGDSIIIGMLLLFFVTDGLNVLLSHSQNFVSTYLFTTYTKLSTISKGIGISFSVYYFFIRQEYFKHIGLLVLSLGLFAIVGIDFRDNEHIFTWFIRLFKLLLPFLLLFFIKELIGKDRQSIFKVLSGLISIQSITVVLSFVFGWQVFWTYGAHRFGYSGFLIAQNEASFFYVIASIFILQRWLVNKNKRNLVLLGLVLAASVLLGAKTVYITIFMFPLYLYFEKGKQSWMHVLVAGIIVSGIFLIAFLIGAFDFYTQFLQTDGWLTVVTSLRDQLIQERLPIVFENWRWYNYLFGGVNPATSFVEMDIIDLFTFVGIIGSLLYYFVLFKVLFNFSKKNYLGWFLVSQYFIIGGLAGHVFASGINAIYLALTCYYLQLNDPGRVYGLIPTENKVLPTLRGWLNFKI